MKHLTVLTLIASVLLFGCGKSSTTPDNPTPATTFTLGSTSGNCTGAVLAGTYTAGTALTSANTVTIDVNVTVVGAYTISTNTINGISFSAKGTFTATGAQTVILAGTGTPTAAETDNLTITAGSNSCEFSVTTAAVTATIPPAGDYITCDINGTYTTFNVDASASNYATESNNPVHTSGLAAGGFAIAGSNDPQLSFGVSNANNTGTIGVGTYTNTGFSMGFDYTDASSNLWAIGSGTGSTFTIIVTYVDTYNIQGTFSGTLKSEVGTGPTSMSITNGQFNLPVYN